MGWIKARRQWAEGRALIHRRPSPRYARKSRFQISPRGVLSTTKVNGLDREVTPRGEICHLRSRRAAARCARNGRFQISDLQFEICHLRSRRAG